MKGKTNPTFCYDCCQDKDKCVDCFRASKYKAPDIEPENEQEELMRKWK